MFEARHEATTGALFESPAQSAIETKIMKHTKHNSGRLATTAALVALAIAPLAMSGCRGDRSDKPPRQFFPDMDDSPKFKPQSESEFFADGRAMRPAVEGTVAFGASPRADEASREGYLAEDDAIYRGVDSTGQFVARIPAAITVDRAFLLKGQEKFNIYCAACHNYDGHGKGTVGAQWSYALPNFHDAKYFPGAMEDVADPVTKVSSKRIAKTGLDGYIFSTIRNGVENGAKMPPYGHALKPMDAWAVVAYFRALQASENGTLAEDVPADRRADAQRVIDAARAKWEKDEAERKAAEAKAKAEDEKKKAEDEAKKKATPPAPPSGANPPPAMEKKP